MKLLRIWLLITLCVLLPLRGALAAAMVCPPAGSSAPSGAMLVSPQTDGGHAHADHGVSPAHAHVPADAGVAAHGHADAGAGQDNCTACAAFCSLSPAPPGQTPVVAPAGMAAAPQACLKAEAPSFIPGGLERPPRSS